MKRLSKALQGALLGGILATGMVMAVPVARDVPDPESDSTTAFRQAFKANNCWDEGDHPMPTAALVLPTATDKYAVLVTGPRNLTSAMDVTFKKGDTYHQVLAYCIPNRKASS